MKIAKAEHRQNGFVFKGMYIKVFIKDFPFNKLDIKKPIIVSTLLKNERKMTILHMKIQRLASDPPF